MYTVSSFGRMILDEVRVAAYENAMRAAIFPGAVVAEIGAGTGFFSMLACRMGAAKVYAMEPNPAVWLARDAAAANGLDGRIQVIHDLSTRVNLPEKADILLSDLRGVIPLMGRHIPSIIDARKRLLKPGGVQIPARDRIFAALSGDAASIERELRPWEQERHGIDWTPVRRVVMNQWYKARLEEDALLACREMLVDLDYRSVESPNLDAAVEFRPRRAGRAHGVLLSFEADLFGGVGFSTGPESPDSIYSSAFFPIEGAPAVTPDDTVRVRFRAQLTGGDYVWTWSTVLNGKALCTQSTMKGAPLSPHDWRRSSVEHRPVLRREGEAARWILGRMDGKATAAELAKELRAEYPELYPLEGDALDRIVELTRDYGE